MSRNRNLWCQHKGLFEDDKCMDATDGGAEYCGEHTLGRVWPSDDD